MCAAVHVYVHIYNNYVLILILSLPCVKGVIGGTKVRRVKAVIQLNFPSAAEIRVLCNYKNCARIPLLQLGTHPRGV